MKGNPIPSLAVWSILSLGGVLLGCGSSASDGSATPAAGTGGTMAGTGGTMAATGGTTAGEDPAIPGTVCTTQLKNGACTTEGETCNKSCGPRKAGYKPETCVDGVYVEGACLFPPGDYACFKVTEDTPACPDGTQTGGSCTGECAACSGYADSTGTPKNGYCICVNGKYTCGSYPKEWPCTTAGTSASPGGTGC
jgi:hypothetical protein